ncbi:MAG: ferredoxin [Desulfobacterales bacterium]|nr:ferredoxin [Desulfobacterales bacterium]
MHEVTNLNERISENITGKYYVNYRCIGCMLCSEIASANFTSNHLEGYDYVYKQPENDTEEQLCIELMDICPVNAIGNDG